MKHKHILYMVSVFLSFSFTACNSATNVSDLAIQQTQVAIQQTQVALQQTQIAIQQLPTAILSAPTAENPPMSPSVLPMDTPIPNNTAITSAPGSILFSDDFNDGNADGWLPAAANWNLVEGQYICIGGLDARSFIGEDYWRDYLVSAKVKLISGDVNAGVLGHLKDADHYYYAQLYRGRARIYIQNGGWRELASVPYATANGRWYKVGLEFRGTELKMYVDNVLVASAEDAVILNGKIGLECNDSQIYFDDVQVTTP